MPYATIEESELAELLCDIDRAAYLKTDESLPLPETLGQLFARLTKTAPYGLQVTPEGIELEWFSDSGDGFYLTVDTGSVRTVIRCHE